MKLRVSLYDLCAAIVVLAVILVPARSAMVQGAYDRISERDRDLGTPQQIDEIAELQGKLAVDPGDAESAEKLGRLLERLEQHDQSLRVGGDAAQSATPTQWRAYYAVSSAHAERLRYVLRTGEDVIEELELALKWADKAVDACLESTECDAQSKGRLSLYRTRLKNGVDAIAAGLDPSKDPAALEQAMGASARTATFRGQ